MPFLLTASVLPCVTITSKKPRRSSSDPNILINVVSRRVKQLKRGSRPLVESLEKLAPEDIALREIIEGKISHEIPEN